MKKILFSIGMLVFTTAAFSQNCFKFSGVPFFSGPAANGKYSLNINFDNDGTKSVGVVVKCGSTVILDTCFRETGMGSSILTDLTCASGLGALSADFTLRAGSCSSSICDSLKIRPIGGPLLPIRLNNLVGIRTKQAVALSWSTEEEVNAKEFIIERAEGNEFRSVGTVTSVGNSTTKQQYSFLDKNENASLTYYRLKIVDQNGAFTYSEIKSVKGVGSTSDVTIFPNPARSNSKVSLVGVAPNSSIQLLDFSGKVLKNMNSTSSNSIDLSGVKGGSYLIRIVDKLTNEVVNKKLTVSN